MAPRRVDPNALSTHSPLGAVLAHAKVAARAPVRLEHDARTVWGREGEPLALSLLADGAHTLSRSVKFHRPRGPACLRGACEGCLVRLDDTPNAMACRERARDGAVVRSQNAFPTARLDVLRVTDWFFPREFDHHHLLVDFGPALNRAMQVFARRMAGLGTLPEQPREPPAPRVLRCDALVVGAGPAGLAAAHALARGGARTVLLEEEPHPGGALCDALALVASDRGPLPARAFADALAEHALRAGAALHTSASAVATYDEGTLAVTAERALWIEAPVRVFANGTHELVPAFESNDLPGVYTARAVARALANGVLVGARVLLAGAPCAYDFGLAEALREAGAEVLESRRDERLVAVEGRGSVRAAVLRGERGERTEKCDAVALREAPVPAYELLAQAGAATRWSTARGAFVPALDEATGVTERAGLFAAGALARAHDPGPRVDEDAGPVSLAAPHAAQGPVAHGARVGAVALAWLRSTRDEAPR